MSGSRYLDIVRGSSGGRRAGGWQFTSKNLLSLLATVAMIGAAFYWWGVQSALTVNILMAGAFTAILVFAPPSLTSFIIPWSPGGMLLQKINARTWGFTVVIGAALYLLYYSFDIQYSWWSSQPAVAATGLILQQTIIGIIGFIIIPALLWSPVSSEELVEQVRQAHLVRRYELQVQADIAILRATLMRGQELALNGIANLSLKEKEELARTLLGLVMGIEQTLEDIGKSVKVVSGATVPRPSLADNPEIRGYLTYIYESVSGQQADGLFPSREQQPESAEPVAAPIVRGGVRR